MATASQSCVSKFSLKNLEVFQPSNTFQSQHEFQNKALRIPLAIHSKTRSNLFAQVEKQVIEKGEKKTLYTARFLYCLHDPRKPVDFY
jgi:hypothetical protein